MFEIMIFISLFLVFVVCGKVFKFGGWNLGCGWKEKGKLDQTGKSQFPSNVCEGFLRSVTQQTAACFTNKNRLLVSPTKKILLCKLRAYPSRCNSPNRQKSTHSAKLPYILNLMLKYPNYTSTWVIPCQTTEKNIKKLVWKF